MILLETKLNRRFVDVVSSPLRVAFFRTQNLENELESIYGCAWLA
jgi:hypothetical protein